MAERITDSSDSAETNPTRLPVFRTWPAVYAFVVATFVLWVTLLAGLGEDVLVNGVDWAVLLITILGIAGYGIRGTRGQQPSNFFARLRRNELDGDWPLGDGHTGQRHHVSLHSPGKDTRVDWGSFRITLEPRSR